MFLLDLKFLLSRFQTNKAYKRVWKEERLLLLLLLLLFKPHSFSDCYDEDCRMRWWKSYCNYHHNWTTCLMLQYAFDGGQPWHTSASSTRSSCSKAAVSRKYCVQKISLYESCFFPNGFYLSSRGERLEKNAHSLAALLNLDLCIAL